MTLSTNQIILYAADPNDFVIALAASITVGIPACQVTGDFYDAWIYTVSHAEFSASRGMKIGGLCRSLILRSLATVVPSVGSRIRDTV